MNHDVACLIVTLWLAVLLYFKTGDVVAVRLYGRYHDALFTVLAWPLTLMLAAVLMLAVFPIMDWYAREHT